MREQTMTEKRGHPTVPDFAVFIKVNAREMTFFHPRISSMLREVGVRRYKT